MSDARSRLDAEDAARGAFLAKLHASDAHLTEFEENFIASFQANKLPQNFWTGFPRRRAVCDEMMRRYSGVRSALAAPRIGRAAPGGCQRLTGDFGEPRRECGRPSTHEGTGRNRLKYCESCAAWMPPGSVRPLNV